MLPEHPGATAVARLASVRDRRRGRERRSTRRRAALEALVAVHLAVAPSTRARSRPRAARAHAHARSDRAQVGVRRVGLRPRCSRCCFIPSLLHNTKATVSAKPDKRATCLAAGDHLVAGTNSVQRILYHPSDFVLEFVLLVVLGVRPALRGLALDARAHDLHRSSSASLRLVAGTSRPPRHRLRRLAAHALVAPPALRRDRLGKTVRKVATERADEKREAKREAQAVAPGRDAGQGSRRRPPSATRPKSKPRRK